jgi:hypothetical protein
VQINVIKEVTAYFLLLLSVVSIVLSGLQELSPLLLLVGLIFAVTAFLIASWLVPVREYFKETDISIVRILRFSIWLLLDLTTIIGGTFLIFLDFWIGVYLLLPFVVWIVVGRWSKMAQPVAGGNAAR